MHPNTSLRAHLGSSHHPLGLVIMQNSNSEHSNHLELGGCLSSLGLPAARWLPKRG